MNIPKYTFLLPAYKSKFFAEALESIKKQTYKEFVCLVSDDCSPKELKSVFDEVIGDDPRFTFRRNAENMGGNSLVSHWNLLVDMCETEFLIMASDDDLYEPNFLEEINKLTVKYPEVDLFRGKIMSINEKGELLIHDAYYPEYMDHAHFFRKNFASDFLTCEACYCYRTNSLKGHGGYVDFPSAWFTDDATHILMAKKGCASTSVPVFRFRQSTINISNTFANAEDSRKKVEAAIMFNKWISSYLPNIDKSEERLLIQTGMSECEKKIIRNIENNLQFCNWRNFRRLTKAIKGKLSISFPVLLYFWTRIHLHH